MVPLLVNLQRQLATSGLQRLVALYRHRAWRYEVLSRLVENVICVDIGAAHFPHAKWWLFLQSPKTRWLAIDPAHESLNYAKNWRWRCLIESMPVAVAAETGRGTLHVTNTPTGSSLLQPRPSLHDDYRYSSQDYSYFFPVSLQQIETVGLSSLLSRFESDSHFVLKLDTQGSEFAILSGISDLFAAQRILAVECEVSLLHSPAYQEAPRLWDVVGTMESRGFELLQLDVIEKSATTRAPRGRGIAIEADALFVLRREFVMSRDLGLRLQLLCVYATYGLFEEAKLLLRDDQELLNYVEGAAHPKRLKL